MLSALACVKPSGIAPPIATSTSSTTVSLRWTHPVNDGGCPITSYWIVRNDGTDSGAITTLVDKSTIENKPYLFTHTTTLSSSLTGKRIKFKLYAKNS